MAKTSVHFQPCKEISEIHNYRKKKLDYVRTQLTNKNENWMWDSSKSLADRREEIRKLVKEKTGTLEAEVGGSLEPGRLRLQ